MVFIGTAHSGRVFPKRVRVISKSTGRIFSVGRHDLHLLPSGKRAWVPARGPVVEGRSSRRERPQKAATKQPEVRPIRAPAPTKTSNRFSPLSVERVVPKSKTQTYADAVRAKPKPVQVKKGVVTLKESARDTSIFNRDEQEGYSLKTLPGQTLQEAKELSAEFTKRTCQAFSGRRFEICGLPGGNDPFGSPSPAGPIPAQRVLHVDPVSWKNMSYGQCSRVLDLYRKLTCSFNYRSFSRPLYDLAVRKVLVLSDDVPVAVPKEFASCGASSYGDAPVHLYV